MLLPNSSFDDLSDDKVSDTTKQLIIIHQELNFLEALYKDLIDK
jgi:hypothetical protein